MPEKKLTVLLVDDSRTVLSQIEKVVETSEEAEIVGTASNGAEAIQKASELKPDLVIMDIVMPDIDGLAALRMLQAKQPEIRVAMLSSVGGMASKAEEAFRLGAVQVLGKPVDDETLRALFTQEFERLTSQSGS
jgi:YesN/AraC family two-component response regulator